MWDDIENQGGGPRWGVISFIIPAHNEELLLGRTLRPLPAAARAAGEPFEAIVVDDASTDRTAAVAWQHGARVISIDRRQIAAARNAGDREACGELFIFIDADTVVTPAVVRAAVRAVRRGAAGGGCVARFDGRLPLWARLVVPPLMLGQRLLKLVGGCFLFCTRDAFRAAGGFSERYYAAEEVAFVRALKRQGPFVVLHEYAVTSGRKVRTLTARTVVGLLTRVVLRGPDAFQRREGLDAWYGERRADPEARPRAEWVG
jgi:glycosyltransferase involved in cell wall biosynthesis